MGTGMVFIKLMKVEDVQLFNKSVLLKLLTAILFFALHQPFE